MSEPASPKHEQVLKKLQLWLGVLVAVVSLIIGLYNAKKIFFSDAGPGSVSIEVRAENGKPVPQVSIEITKEQGAVIVTTETDANGDFERSGLDVGNYALKISKANFQPDTILFSVESRKKTELNLKMKPAANAIRNAVEELGASWLKEFGSPKNKTQQNP